jgi:hypothetical protein
LLAFLLVATSGCAASAHRSSPWEFGGGVRLAPGFSVGEGNLTAHPMLSYTYLSFDGGHDSLWELGGQIRKPLSSATAGGRPLWIGGEAALSRLNTVVDVPDGQFDLSNGTNGFSLTALAGVPLGQSRWGFNAYAGAGISNYGSTGFNLRLGVDLQPWFLAR